MTIVEFQARSERLRDGTRLVSVAGDLDLYTAPQLERAVLAAAGDGATVLVDLTDCTFVDSTALGILIEANRRLKHGSGVLKIVADAPAIRRPFEITGLDRVFDFYPSRAAALNGQSR